MPTNEERHEIARRLRDFCSEAIPMVLALDTDNNPLIALSTLALIVCGDSEVACKEVTDRLADLIEPESETEWHDFSEELPPRKEPVLCKSANGVYYVGKPVTFNGEITDSVWVPRGGQYRRPAKWSEISNASRPSKERTCRNISNSTECFYCSECRWGDFGEQTHTLTKAWFDGGGIANYCPNCGAKVVEK